MRLRFGEKRERKVNTRCLLVIFGWVGISSMELVENAEFFAQGDRRARFKESSRNQLVDFLAIMVVVYIFIHIIWIR